MDRMVEIAVSLIAVQTLITSIIVWIVQRVLGKKLDMMDEKRELARRKADSEAEDGRMWRQSMESGMRSLLRAEIIAEHRKWTKRGYCPLESKEYLTRCHSSYRGVNGNDIGDALYEQVMALPTKVTDTSE